MAVFCLLGMATLPGIGGDCLLSGCFAIVASLLTMTVEGGVLLAQVKADLEAFAGGLPQQDDITLLVLSKD